MHSIKVLGSGCANCERLTVLADKVLSDLGREERVEKVTDYAVMAKMGVMATPALAVDDQVVLAGRIPSPDALKELLAGQLSGSESGSVSA